MDPITLRILHLSDLHERGPGREGFGAPRVAQMMTKVALHNWTIDVELDNSKENYMIDY